VARGRRSRSPGSESGRLAAAPGASAWVEACRLLARVPRAAAEVEAHLARRGFAAATIAATVRALRARRWLDDAALARRLAEDRLLRRGWGRLRVARELTLKGLADTVVEQAVSAAMENRSDAELARKALRRRFRDRPLASDAARGRAFRYLVGRGHPPEAASAALEEDS
jgi:regulatory protein